MLRNFFVLALVSVGIYYALYGPFYALLFYIGNAYFRPEEWVWTNFVPSLKLSFISGAYVVLASLFSGQRFVWNSRVALLWLFLFQTLLSTLGSEHFSYSWSYWTDFCKTIIITYLIVVLVTDFSRLRLVLLVMVFALGLEQAKQGWVYLLTSPGWHNANPVPFLGDNNGVAVGMLMLVPIVGLLGQTTHDKWVKLFYHFLLIGCLFRALSTYSRGGFLAGIAMGGVWCLRSRYKLRALLAMLIVIAVVLPVLPDAYWNRMHTIRTYKEVGDESALGRLHFWAVAVQMANTNPLLGVGYSDYNPAYDNYDFSHGLYGKVRSVHSSFFGVLGELGYLGAALYIFIVFDALCSCSRVRKQVVENSASLEISQSTRALETSLVAFVVGGSFVPFQYTEILWHIIALTIVLERLAAQHKAEMLASKPLEILRGSTPTRMHIAA